MVRVWSRRFVGERPLSFVRLFFSFMFKVGRGANTRVTVIRGKGSKSCGCCNHVSIKITINSLLL